MCLSYVKVKSSEKYDQFRGILTPLSGYSMLPCGKCLECKQLKIEEWQIRWHEQLKVSVPNSSYMLTLTYSDDHLPHAYDQDGVIVSTLEYSDVTKFLKRLRRRQEYYCQKHKIQNPKISYHGCGEYGKNGTKRPHYHLVITNLILDPSEIENIWSHGLVHVGDNVNGNTVKYVLKYALKNTLDNPDAKDTIRDDEGRKIVTIYTNGDNVGRVVEKSFCSKGIGANWLTPENIQLYRDNPEYNYILVDEEKQTVKAKPIPRYWREKIFNPVKKENGKTVMYEGRPVRLWDPLSEDYENTPRFKKQLLMFQRQTERINQFYEDIQQFGEMQLIDKYLNEKRAYLSKELNYHEKYQQFLAYNIKLAHLENVI